MANLMNEITYRSSGVDIDAGNELVRLIKPLALSTARKGADPNIGGYAGLFDPKAAGFKDPLFMAATDGVGSKLKIAADCGKYDTIGIDLVAMCVNDLLVSGVEPLVFLDYLACGKLDLQHAQELIKGIVAGCKLAGCALVGGETAEMPGLYKDKDFDLAGFAVGAIERTDLLPEKNGNSGDVLIALRSSGLHSNGFSLVRKFLQAKNIALTDSLPFDKAQNWGDFLLIPTRIYVKSVLPVLRQHKTRIKGLAHITGGGVPDNLPRILPPNIGAEIKMAEAAEALPVIRYFYDEGIAKAELLRTFNCGVGMVLVVSPEAADEVMQELKAEKPLVIGQLCEGKGYTSLFE